MGRQGRSFACRDCGAAFPYKSQLKKHLEQCLAARSPAQPLPGATAEQAASMQREEATDSWAAGREGGGAGLVEEAEPEASELGHRLEDPEKRRAAAGGGEGSGQEARRRPGDRWLEADRSLEVEGRLREAQAQEAEGGGRQVELCCAVLCCAVLAGSMAAEAEAREEVRRVEVEREAAAGQAERLQARLLQLEEQLVQEETAAAPCPACPGHAADLAELRSVQEKLQGQLAVAHAAQRTEQPLLAQCC
jgi:hypothetical protein